MRAHTKSSNCDELLCLDFFQHLRYTDTVEHCPSVIRSAGQKEMLLRGLEKSIPLVRDCCLKLQFQSISVVKLHDTKCFPLPFYHSRQQLPQLSFHPPDFYFYFLQHWKAAVALVKCQITVTSQYLIVTFCPVFRKEWPQELQPL